jgi:DNA-binding transcriptional MerR regulator
LRLKGLSVDLDEMLTSAQAASLAGVAVATIRKWVERELLEASGHDERGRPLYRLIDVAKAERSTRDRARRTFQPS